MIEPDNQQFYDAPFHDTETGISSSDFRFFHNGLDLAIQTDSKYFIYEDQCFQALLDLYPNLYGIGPHLIDRVFGMDPLFRQIIRPDAVLIIPGEKPELTGLAEFKFSGTNGYHRKVNGFSRWLNHLRNGPNSISDLLNKSTKYVEFPSIEIPPDSEVFVRFISQRRRLMGDDDIIPTDPSVGFVVRHTSLRAEVTA